MNKMKEPSPHFPILIAEDNPVSRKLLEKTLLKAGYEVTSVENGRKALELFNKKFVIPGLLLHALKEKISALSFPAVSILVPHFLLCLKAPSFIKDLQDPKFMRFAPLSFED